MLLTSKPPLGSRGDNISDKPFLQASILCSGKGWLLTALLAPDDILVPSARVCHLQLLETGVASFHTVSGMQMMRYRKIQIQESVKTYKSKELYSVASFDSDFSKEELAISCM